MSRINDAKVKKYRLKNLFVDPNNFRLRNESNYNTVPEHQFKERNVQDRTLRMLRGHQNENIKDLIASFKSNGYLPVDQIQVRELIDGGYLIVEGNRRVATLKYLQKQYELEHIDLGKLDPAIFTAVPVVIYPDGDTLHYLTIAGLNHIGSKKKWAESNQARLLQELSRVHNLSDDEICERIGISKTELRRNLRALSLVDQYIESDYGDQFRERQFVIFREIVFNQKIKAWLDWNENTFEADGVSNREQLFSWLSIERVDRRDEDGNLISVDELEPALTQRDHIRLLSKIVDDPEAMEELTRSRDINKAYESSPIVFEEQRASALRSTRRSINQLVHINIQSNELDELEDSYRILKSIVDKAKSTETTNVANTTVFHDRIDRHFSRIIIKKYKKLKNLQLSDLSLINLFAGLNDSGKTTVLEAIYLLAHQNDFSGLLEMIRRRGKVVENQLVPRWFVGQVDSVIDIGGVFDKMQASVLIQKEQEQNEQIDMSQYLATVRISAQYDKHEQTSLTRIYKDRSIDIRAPNIKTLCHIVFSSPFFLNEPDRHTQYYHKSVQSKALSQIFNFIRAKVVPTVSDVRLVDDLQRFLVTDSQYDEAMDLTKYGDGLQRIFFISLLFASAQNGVVLIDELENAIHADLITWFTQFIYDLALEFNVQVFLTSHSKECIDAFVKTVSVDSFSAYALVNKENNNVTVRSFSGELFSRLVKAGDVDLRRAQ